MSRFIAWYHGTQIRATVAEDIVTFFVDRGEQVFVVWEVDDDAQEVRHLVAQQLAEGWQFLDGAGEVSLTVPSATGLQVWAAGYLHRLTPLVPLALERNVWEARGIHEPLYTPLGFGTPSLVWGGRWSFPWCPDVVADRLAPLNTDDREALLEAMYARLAWWTELAQQGVPEHERDAVLDERLLGSSEAGAQQCWAVMNRALVSALDA